MIRNVKDIYYGLEARNGIDADWPMTLILSKECAEELYDILRKRYHRESRAKKKCPKCNRKPITRYSTNKGIYICCSRCHMKTETYSTEIEAIRGWNRMVSEIESESSNKTSNDNQSLI